VEKKNQDGLYFSHFEIMNVKLYPIYIT